MQAISLIFALAVSSGAIQQPLPVLPSFGDAFLVAPPSTMEPAFRAGSILVVEPLTGAPKRGDVVVVKNPRNAAVLHALRVVALAGERVELDDGFPIVDGIKQKTLVEFMPPMATGMASFPKWSGQYVVPKGFVYVLADNHREPAMDSMMFGAVSVESVVGAAATWDDVLRTSGRMRSVFNRAFANLRSSLPLEHPDGYSLASVEVLGDAELRLTYRLRDSTLKIDAFSLTSGLCANRWVQQATGIKIQYQFVQTAAVQTNFKFSQSACTAKNR